jgi:hypothetical protein
MAKQTNVTKLAKGGSTNKRRGRPPKKKEESTPPAPAEKTVDVKAKERVAELVEEVTLIPPKEGELLELDETPQDVTDVEWLQEQLGKLSERNELLERENVQSKEDYKKIFEELQAVKSGTQGGPELIPDSILKNNVSALFAELQNNYLGNNPQRQRYTNASVVHLLNKMLGMFPFLAELRRF